MIYSKLLKLQNISLSFSHKTCFEYFSAIVPYGSRIAIIGHNGSGKTSLLKIIQGSIIPDDGAIELPHNTICGYIPQIIENFDSLSGGQRFNAALTKIFTIDPDILLLDEPTNHLDSSNRKSLIRTLNNFCGTLIISSHDPELLRSCIDIFWHINDNKIHVFSGRYDDYISELRTKKELIAQELHRLNGQKKDIHQSLMREQSRAAKSRAKGKKSIDQKKWPTVVSKSKALNAEETSGSKKATINSKKQTLLSQLSELRLPEVISPKFSLLSSDIGTGIVVSINNASVGYYGKQILENLSLSISPGEKLAIAGDNGSGKTTILKAILCDPIIVKSGSWYVPKLNDVGYLDQHYSSLIQDKSALEIIHDIEPKWTHEEIRRHLNNFLFRKNEEVNTIVSNLSGGEKARLSLAIIAAKTPKLLILDEVTNNLDLETRQHMIEVLKEYPGSIIIVSHDEEFLEKIGVHTIYKISNTK
jgi:ATPase subunit of ABC transporter with duplicated ATPase domains